MQGLAHRIDLFLRFCTVSGNHGRSSAVIRSERTVCLFVIVVQINVGAFIDESLKERVVQSFHFAASDRFHAVRMQLLQHRPVPV